MNTGFNQRAEIALHNDSLQQALRHTQGKFVNERIRAMGSLPHGEALRDHARTIRANTLARLDEYLLAFEASARANGSHVHWARDGAEAGAIVCQIALENGVQRIVKGKSMLSEEVGLNHALETAGLTVLETDLGEYIIQISHDRPSHIIAPIIHKTKDEVAALFHQHLGTPPDADIPTLTAAARSALRQGFLQAEMGITGANFGVSDTGSIVLVTNEGNGRFCTSTPAIHVALIGIERIVPTLADLGVLLQVLAASATGQALSAYTSLVSGPRRSRDEDGPDQVHIVLVDNGRTAALASELAEILYCIRCGACLNVCPVYQNVGGHTYNAVYPGPLGIVVNPALDGLGPWNELPQASSLCGACTEACPVRIDIPRMLLKLRADAVEQGFAPAWLRTGIRLYAWAAIHPRLFRLGGRFARLGQRLAPRTASGWTKKLPGPLAGWTQARAFPPLAAESFSQRWQKRAR